MKTNNYNVEHIIETLENRGYTNFLTRKELMLIKGKLPKKEYKVYELYEDSNKVILYKKLVPRISLFKIETSANLRHQDIMGTVFSLGLNEDTFGDILKYQDFFYIFLLPKIAEYFKVNLNVIRNFKVTLVEVDRNLAQNFRQEYLSKELIVTSLRIDNVLSTLINLSRQDVLLKFKNKEVILNYEEELKPTRVLKIGDVFSVKRYGKYKFNAIKKITKKGSFIIEILYFV